MDLLDRYMQAVRTYLPGSLSETQQDDIVNELSENLRAQMDDREAELGHPLSTDEQEAILQRHGHPMIVAGRYQTNPEARVVFGRQLIGPALFPFYVRVLWIVMGISLAISAAVFAVLAISGNPRSFGEGMTTVVIQVAIQFAAITAIFSVMESSLPTLRWSARDLPARNPQARAVPRVSRLESIAEIVGIVVVVAWLWAAFDRPVLLFGPRLDNYQLGPVWQQVAVPVLVILAVSIAQAIINLFRPEWVRFRRAVHVGTELAGLGILIYLLRADHWIVLANGSPNAPDSVNQFVFYGLLSTAIGFVIVILLDSWKLIRGERPREQARQPQTA